MRKNGFTLKSKACDRERAFTLIEMLVVMAIIGILVTISAFALQGARSGARDSRRKADIETIRVALELYRADCNGYPSSVSFGGSLKGNDSVPGCGAANVYLPQVPQDPQNPTKTYTYAQSGNGYSVCASLENSPVNASDLTSVCGSCGSGQICNYMTTNP